MRMLLIAAGNSATVRPSSGDVIQPRQNLNSRPMNHLPMKTARSMSADSAERKSVESPTTDGVVPFSLHELSREIQDCAESTRRVRLRFGSCSVSDGSAPYEPGQVITLTEDIDAPIELLVDQHVAAVGQLVTRDGKLGIQITHVVTHREDSHAA